MFTHSYLLIFDCWHC